MIGYKNRYETKNIDNKYYIYDKKLQQLVWQTKSKKENESLCKSFNNGCGFQGEIPNFFNEIKHLEKGLTL